MELKYRAWNKNSKEMEYISDLYWFEESGVHDSSGEGHYDNYIIMPFIGLLDKNEQEIYEDDIVEYQEELGKITYHKEEAMFVIEFDTWFTDFDHIYGKELEIVGNIHNNPNMWRN